MYNGLTLEIKSLRKNKKILVLFGLISILAVAIFWRQKIDKKPDEKVAVENQTGEVEVKKLGELPEDFPENFPIYPGAEIKESFLSQDQESSAFSVIWQTTDSVETVGRYYDQELAAEGWDVNDVAEDAGAIVFSFSQGDFTGFAAIDSLEAGEVVISVSMGKTDFEPSI